MKMGSNYLAILGVTTVTTVMSCSPAKKEYASFELYPVRTGSLTEMEYTPLATKFYLWSPTAEEVRLMLYDAGEGGRADGGVGEERFAAIDGKKRCGLRLQKIAFFGQNCSPPRRQHVRKTRFLCGEIVNNP